MKLILEYLKKFRGAVILAMLIKLSGTLGELLIPYILEHLIDHVVPGRKLLPVLLWGAVMLGLALLVRFLNVTANRMAVKVSRDSTYEIRQRLFEKTLRLSGGQMDAFGLPSLISRMTSDSYNVQNFIRAGQTIGIRAPIMLVGGIIITLTMDVGLASILCIMSPIMLAIIATISWKGIPLFHRVQQGMDDIVRTMRENITGIRVVKALSREDHEVERFRAVNEEMTKRDLRASILMALPGPIMQLFLNGGLTLVVLIGARRVNAGVTEPGVILAFLTYFNMILMGVMALNRVFIMMSRANASAGRIAAVIDAPEELLPLPEAEAAQTEKEGFIVFDDVTFSYGEEEETEDKQEAFAGEGRHACLSHIDFAMKKGGSLGIIGATGSGKTSLINLLMRFYEADEGAVFVDGKDVRTYACDDLRRRFGVVFQNDVIFADTLRENIVFGRDVDEARLRQAAEEAQAYDFIDAYEEKFDHEAVIRGANLSGGQKQRVLISRALAGHPDILILDDSSSALDYRTDANLRAAIRKNYPDVTLIVIAQRASSIMALDDILVLDEGRVIGHGTHEELQKSCAVYAEICRTQMGEVSA